MTLADALSLAVELLAQDAGGGPARDARRRPARGGRAGPRAPAADVPADRRSAARPRCSAPRTRPPACRARTSRRPGRHDTLTQDQQDGHAPTADPEGPLQPGPAAAVTIAVTGATGALGTAVALLLAEAGVQQRLVVSDASRAPRLAGAEVAVGVVRGHRGDGACARRGAHAVPRVRPRGSRPDLAAPQRGRGRPALPVSSGWSTPRSWVRRRRRPSPTHATTPPPSSPYATPAWR